MHPLTDVRVHGVQPVEHLLDELGRELRGRRLPGKDTAYVVQAGPQLAQDADQLRTGHGGGAVQAVATRGTGRRR
ncbi:MULTISPECIES: hypothetical protein [Streptomyces]|uniref:hypothetical protein n=1 Tax=Streptomyces TaxID=1883 RepID=UPI001670CDDB|nr:hypothetical protein [Streptomyces ruber]